MPTASIQFSGIDQPFVARFRNRRVNATPRSSREWAGQLARDRNPFFFSARCSDAKLLSAMQRYLERDMSGERAHGKARFISDMRRLLGVPLSGEADSGKLTDLKSARRLGLIYDFHKQRARAEQAQAAVDNDDHRIAFPYRELYRPSSSHPKAPRNWVARAASLGFTIKQGRIFAPRDSILWRKLNRFGFDHAPWDYNSGMDTCYIDRATAIQLGLPLVSYAEAIENPRAVLPEQAETEKQRKQYFAAKPMPEPEIQQWALKDLESMPAVPFTAEQAKTLPLEAFIPPEAFVDRNAQKAYLDRKWEAAAKAGMPKNLSPQQSGALKRYTDNSSEINRALREKRKNCDARLLEAVFKKAELGMNLNVVRTASVREAEAFLGLDFTGDVAEQLETLVKSGIEPTFPNIMSTSMFSRFVPKGVRDKKTLAVEYRVRINRGAHAIFLDAVSTKGPYGLSGSSRATKAPPRLWSRDGKNAETEIAIAPGSKFRVEKHDLRNESGLQKLIIWLTLVS